MAYTIGARLALSVNYIEEMIIMKSIKKITYAIRFYWYTFILLRLRVFVIIIPVIVLL